LQTEHAGVSEGGTYGKDGRAKDRFAGLVDLEADRSGSFGGVGAAAAIVASSASPDLAATSVGAEATGASGTTATRAAILLSMFKVTEDSALTARAVHGRCSREITR
jgi:hypothetical protein